MKHRNRRGIKSLADFSFQRIKDETGQFLEMIPDGKSHVLMGIGFEGSENDDDMQIIRLDSQRALRLIARLSTMLLSKP